jgi:hypothetical protein
MLVTFCKESGLTRRHRIVATNFSLKLLLTAFQEQVAPSKFTHIGGILFGPNRQPVGLSLDVDRIRRGSYDNSARVVCYGVPRS